MGIRSHLFVIGVISLVLVVAVPSAFAGKGGHGASSGSSSGCSVSPNPAASGADVTVSGTAGHKGDWVNAYIYYSDGYWGFMGGSVGGGGSFFLTGLAQETHTSLWGPFYAVPSGPARVDIYAGDANRDLGLVETCSFAVI